METFSSLKDNPYYSPQGDQEYHEITIDIRKYIYTTQHNTIHISNENIAFM